MSEAIESGIHRRTLYSMRDAGILEQISRGLYRLADLPELTDADLVTVAMRAPTGVICLVSALSYHNITSQIVHEIQVALEREKTEPPRIEYPPVRVFWFTGAAFSEGIETHEIDGVTVRIYSPEKTLADCFKFRNKIGVDIAIEALKLYKERMRIKADDILRYARICRVEKVMKPYLEAIL